MADRQSWRMLLQRQSSGDASPNPQRGRKRASDQMSLTRWSMGRADIRGYSATTVIAAWVAVRSDKKTSEMSRR